MVLHQIKLVIFYRGVFRIIDMFNKIYRFIFMECGMRLKYVFYETVILFINITFRKKGSNFFKDEVDAYFVNEGKICRVKPMKQNQ